jgi:hypothetical protein
MSTPAFRMRLYGYRWALGILLVFIRDVLRAATASLVPAARRRRPTDISRAPSVGPVTSDDFRCISEPGFGDRWSTYPWSMQWWRGKLYVGVGRGFPCLEYYAVHSKIPLQRYPPRMDRDVRCPKSPYDIQMEGRIWCYTPSTGVWNLIYESPRNLRAPAQPDKLVPADVAYRNMLVFRERSGTEALYVLGVSPRPLDPALPPPRILRTTDGIRFDPLPAAPGTTLGSLQFPAFRSAVAYRDRLYVVASDLWGGGILLEAAKPECGNDHFRQVSPSGMNINEMADFHGFLYLALRDPFRGYSVVKTDATGAPPYRFQTIVAPGAGRKHWRSHTALSLQAFQDYLYVGTDCPAEMIRIDASDRWELIVGNPRNTPLGRQSPRSGLRDGFDYPLNRAILRMHAHDGKLYAGTASTWGVKLRHSPVLGKLLGPKVACDLYVSSDGLTFEAITRDGFGVPTNGAIRTFASTPLGLFLGTLDERMGARIYLGRPAQHWTADTHLVEKAGGAAAAGEEQR